MEANFWNEMRKIKKHMNQFFSHPDFFESNCESNCEGNCEPHNFRRAKADFKETDNGFLIALEIPGVSKEDIKVNLTEQGLEIKAEKKIEKHTKPESDKCCHGDSDDACHCYGYMKSSLGFYRMIALPEQADTESLDKIHAVYKDGILRLAIPKKKTDKKDKLIRVE